MKNLYKHKNSVTTILVEELKESKMIFSASYDGEIAIFDRDIHGDFNIYRNISMKKMNSTSNITALCYQHSRYTLMVGTSSGEIIFVDIDKNKMISKC